MIFQPVDQQQQQQKNLIVRIVNLELWIIVLYSWDAFCFSGGFGHMIFHECNVWVHSLFYLLLHAWIVLYICNFFLFLIVIVIVMRFINEPPGNPLPRYDTNKLIDWLITLQQMWPFLLSQYWTLASNLLMICIVKPKFVYTALYNSKVSTRKVVSTDQRNIVNCNLLCYWLFRQFWQHNWWTSFARWGGGWGEKKWRESIHSSTDPTSEASNQWQTVLSHPMGGFQAMHTHQIHVARPS